MNGFFYSLYNNNSCRGNYVPMENIHACNGIGYDGGKTPYGSGKYLRNIYSGNGFLPNVYNIGAIDALYVE